MHPLPPPPAQLVLVLGASSRQLWADLRGTSPASPPHLTCISPVSRLYLGRWADLRGTSSYAAPAQERSLLGTLVDPLGLFRASALINNGERDRAALAAAERLATLATELLQEASSAPNGGAGVAAAPAGGGAAPDAVDRQQLVRALATKALQRREDVRKASRRIAVEALDQAVERLGSRAGARV